MEQKSNAYFYDLDFKPYNVSEKSIGYGDFQFSSFVELLEECFAAFLDGRLEECDDPELPGMETEITEGAERGGAFTQVFKWVIRSKFYQLKDIKTFDDKCGYKYLCMLVSCADKTLPDSTYTDFNTGDDETFKSGENRAPSYSSHILFRYKDSDRRILVLYESNPNMSAAVGFSSYMRGIIKNLKKRYKENFEVKHPRGERDKKGEIKKVSCSISFNMKGHVSEEFEDDLKSAKSSHLDVLVEKENVFSGESRYVEFKRNYYIETKLKEIPKEGESSLKMLARVARDLFSKGKIEDKFKLSLNNESKPNKTIYLDFDKSKSDDEAISLSKENLYAKKIRIGQRRDTSGLDKIDQSILQFLKYNINIDK